MHNARRLYLRQSTRSRSGYCGSRCAWGWQVGRQYGHGGEQHRAQDIARLAPIYQATNTGMVIDGAIRDF
jgi:hypothetical protein